MWMVVAMGILFAVLGQVLMTAIKSDWKYLFFNVTPGGLIIAGFFLLCIVSNFIGSRFCIEAEFASWLPSRIIVLAALIAVASLFVALPLGAENRWAVYIICFGAGFLVLSVPAAFFIRGMTVPTEHDS
ncbi:MAG: hypothetical protein P4L74_05750 [Candidatus Doudnabacteria bacterium]|nr:hypothetical protein [Candidatus Doudnabacteria bacterium]